MSKHVNHYPHAKRRVCVVAGQHTSHARTMQSSYTAYCAVQLCIMNELDHMNAASPG